MPLAKIKVFYCTETRNCDLCSSQKHKTLSDQCEFVFTKNKCHLRVTHDVCLHAFEETIIFFTIFYTC